MFYLQTHNNYIISKDKQTFFIFGIIDILNTFCLKKKMEKFAKKLINLDPKLDTSAQPPQKYADRFVRFVETQIKFE